MKKIAKLTKVLLMGTMVVLLLIGGIKMKPMIDPPGGFIIVQTLK